MTVGFFLLKKVAEISFENVSYYNHVCCDQKFEISNWLYNTKLQAVISDIVRMGFSWKGSG